MATLNRIFTALASFNPATPLDTAMIFLDIPSPIFERFSVWLRCIQNVSYPVFSFFVRVNNPEYLYKPVL
jgi:hypothetical protein